MIRFFTKLFAKLSYLWQLEFESAKSDLNADLAKRNADEKHKLVSKLNSPKSHISYFYAVTVVPMKVTPKSGKLSRRPILVRRRFK
jgi:hypothetical protein